MRVIAPYRWHGVWVFDDPAVGLVREPFICGADLLMDRLAMRCGGTDRLVLYFSDAMFPDADHEAVLIDPNVMGGAVYDVPSMEVSAWLCPALFKYFDSPPDHLYFRAMTDGGQP
jgi:hypothetical protein